MKISGRTISIRISRCLAVASMLAASATLTATAAGAEKAHPYPESLQKWVDGGKYVKFEGLDIFVHTSGEDPVKETGAAGKLFPLICGVLAAADAQV